MGVFERAFDAEFLGGKKDRAGASKFGNHCQVTMFTFCTTLNFTYGKLYVSVGLLFDER